MTDMTPEQLMTSVDEQMPEFGVPVIGYNREWINEDFNHHGLRECFIYGDGTQWHTAKWNDGPDCYETTDDDKPTHWSPMLNSAALSANGGEAVAWQFYQDGKWWNGDDSIKAHRANTEAAGIPIRELFTAPPPVAQNVEWFFYDAENGNIEICETKEEALSKAQKAVDFCFDECWSDEVEQICVGTITHRAKQTDLMFKPQKLDEDMFSEDGEHWPEDCESKCDYSIEPVDPQPQGGGE